MADISQDRQARPLRVFYAAGPGNVIGTFKHWKEGRDDPTRCAVTYSGQLYDVCHELGARALVIASHSKRRTLRHGAFRIEHWPNRFRSARGAAFHLGQILYGLRLITSALSFRADVAVVSEGCHWFLLSLLTWSGVKVVPALHARVYQRANKKRILKRVLNRLNARFFRQYCFAILIMPHELAQQVEEMTGGKHRAFIEWIPLYDPRRFRSVRKPDFPQRPFRVLFAGRIEVNKGVFDLLAVARRVVSEGRSGIEFDVCGTGSALEELRSAAAKAGVAERFRCHGYCDHEQMRRMYERSHVVVVPTRKESGEGVNQVAVEAILTGRPVITSSAWMSWKTLMPEAVVEVAADDAAAYGDAIIRLSKDRALYEQKCLGCLAAQSQFLDPDRSWGAALRRVLTAVRDNRQAECCAS